MTKRSYHRRSDDEKIAELQSKIAQLEVRMEADKRPDGEVLSQFPKVKRNLARFSQLCVDNGRHDLSNSTLAFINMLEKQSQEIPDSMRMGMNRNRVVRDAV
ncbi:MAG: hypothetical protein ACI9HE_002418 [Planctomycetota bacterium]|jgi:hypothetical protein